MLTNKTLLVLAGALIASTNAQFYSNWDKQGQCYVTSKVYKVKSTTEQTFTSTGYSDGRVGSTSWTSATGSAQLSAQTTKAQAASVSSQGSSSVPQKSSTDQFKEGSSSTLSSTVSSERSSASLKYSESSSYSSEYSGAASSSKYPEASSSSQNPEASSSSEYSEASSSAEYSEASSSSSSSFSPSSSAVADLFCAGLTPTLSCTDGAADVDSCCVENPGGLVLLTQFWDYDPSVGPVDEFTIHGLWPDNCDGSYGQYCAPELEIQDPRSIVSSFNQSLVNEMDRIWKDYKGNDDSLWDHEFNKHATCMSTIKPKCYGDEFSQDKRVDVYDYFKLTVDTNAQLPTYEWLKADGIVPTNDKTYSRDDILNSLTSHYGYTPFISCDKNGALLEVWYFYHVLGSLRANDLVKTDAIGTTKCPAQIKYPPKGSSSQNSNSTSSGSSSQQTPTTAPLKGEVKSVGKPGCLSSTGEWVSDNCDTFTFTKLSTGSYNLQSSAGLCTLADSKLKCGSDVTRAFEFNYDGSSISANGVTTFSADQEASSNAQSVTSGNGNVEFKLSFSTAAAVPVGASVQGYVKLSDQPGCLIRNGHWYVGGSCATYTATRTADDSITLKTSGGNCGLTSDNAFACTGAVTDATVFKYDASSNTISAPAAEGWGADKVPSGNVQVDVVPGKGTLSFSIYFEAK